MAAFALSELLPNKWRHIGVVLADAAVLVSVTVAPVSARYGIEYGTWQWNFYTGAILQGLSFIGLLLLYFPPAHPYNLQPRQVIKKLDYIGKLLRSSETSGLH
jgi:MFS family permease